MSDLMADAASMVADQLSENFAQTVTYRRGSLSVSLAATPGSSQSVNDRQYGVLEVEERDWLIKKSLLILGGEVVGPEKNDTIEEADGTIWQVLPTDLEPEKRSSDRHGYLWRIHSKQTKVPD